MLQAFFNYFLAPYSKSSMEIQRKTKGHLLGSCIILILIIFSVPPLFIIDDPLGVAITIGILFLTAFCVLYSLWLLRRNKYGTAIQFVTLAGPVAIFFIHLYSTPRGLELGRLVVSYCVILAFIGLIAIRRLHLIVYIIESFVAILVFVFVKFQSGKWVSGPVMTREIFTDLLLFVTCAGFILVSFTIIEERMKLNEKELQEKNNLNKKLQKAKAKLQQEQIALRHKTEVMEAELAIARVMQQKLMPEGNPDPRIACFYRSMEHVGGDFFDFARYGDDRIGIFISDVSGHGVPAALITSMIKSYFSQFSSATNDPAVLLTSLNRALFDQVSGHFITALYGIMNFKTREFVYSSAGHPDPCVQQGGSAKMVDSRGRSYPLCMVPNEEMKKRGRAYSNSRLKLPENGRLLLYTDGLTEAVRYDDTTFDKEDFETTCLMPLLLRAREASIQGFVDGIHHELAAFRGVDSYDDDICIIGIQT
ncbi:MAG TPA: PP2C family protein-serine/threonine phosphatase [Spirochaetota bacterium]|nr:PP2C family protein-serine/threonine phosphatase [Spirochaetota bacterium]